MSQILSTSSLHPLIPAKRGPDRLRTVALPKAASDPGDQRRGWQLDDEERRFRPSRLPGRGAGPLSERFCPAYPTALRLGEQPPILVLRSGAFLQSF